MTSFFIETYGYSHNFAESERMAGLLQQAKFEPAENIETADIILLNVCTANGITSDAFFAHVDTIRREHPYKSIIICGCVAQMEKKRLQNFSVVGSRQIHKIVEVVEETINDNVVKCLETDEMPPLNLPKIRKNQLVEIIPLNISSRNICNTCSTKQSAGELQSYPFSDIVVVAKKAVKDGVKEIWLASQNSFCYGFDINTNLANLLKELLTIPGDFKIRVGMGIPADLIKIKDEFLPLFNDPKVFKFIHIPMQAGSNAVLEKLGQENTIEEFIHLVSQIRETIKTVTIATDVIVGFPTETEDDFWKTLEVVRKTTPEVITISRFEPKLKTPAENGDQIPIEEVNRRVKVLTDIYYNISTLQNERWIDWEGEILITEKGVQEKQWIGRNPAYKPVIVDGDFTVGDVVLVRIIKVGVFELRGEKLLFKNSG